MITPLLAAALALQAAPLTPAPDPVPAPPASVIDLDRLPVAQATSARCAIAFATVSRWQKSGEARGSAYPDMETTGGREYFVQAMAQLMDAADLTRDDIMALATQEVAANSTAEGEAKLAAMMPACLMLKSAAGL
jgi:hypothetical protein